MKLISAITTMNPLTMNPLTLLLLVTTSSHVLSFSDYTLDRYRESQQTVRHGKSKFDLSDIFTSLIEIFYQPSD